MSTGYALRAMRAAVFAALAVVLPACGHVALSGQPLPTGLLVVAGVLIVAGTTLLAARERSYLQIAGLLVPLELALNAVFNLGQEHCASVAATPHGVLGSWSGLLVCGGGSVEPGVFGVKPVSPGSSVTLSGAQILLLIALHVVVALIVAVWLRQGEAAVFRLLQAVGAYAAPALVSLLAWLCGHFGAADPPARPCPTFERDLGGPQESFLCSLSRRGPPAPVTAD